jgi:hypothetical protein
MQYKLSSVPQAPGMRTEHWALVVPLSNSDAHVFQLVGNPATFRYRYTFHHNFLRSEAMRGGVLVGEIPQDKVPSWLTNKLKEVEIIHTLDPPPKFDCQDWALAAIQHLKGDGGVTIYEITEQEIRQEMHKEEERWEAGDANIIKKIYPTD